MQIIAHRGYWKKEEEKNSKIAFERAFDCGFGVETDLRDNCREIVISHDMPNRSEMTFEDLLQLLNGRNLPLALNIKADGLALKIKELLEKYNHTNYFTFDMSVPEMVFQHKIGLKVFAGISDIVPEAILFEKAKGIWLDSFYSDWFNQDKINEILNNNKKVCIVSPDLHKREYKKIWEKYKNISNAMICTDYPDEAERYFNYEN